MLLVDIFMDWGHFNLICYLDFITNAVIIIVMLIILIDNHDRNMIEIMFLVKIMVQ